MKAELNTIIATLKTQYTALEREYTDQCAIDFMSRRATYLDGQLATLHEVIEMLEDANQDEEEAATIDSMFDDDEGEDDLDLDDDVDETNYDPYVGGELPFGDDELWCE